MKKALTTLILFTCISTFAQTAFRETWAYLYKGEEKSFPTNAPITDIACFSASVNGDGGLSGGHMAPPSLPAAHPDTRYHLVITIPWNKTLAHIYLNKELPLRDRIIEAIVERSEPFDGVQIDFEAVDKKDGTAYLNFLAILKKSLPDDKIFSVAAMARWADFIKSNPDDAFNYGFISSFADRVIIMAYDEHYRSGPPGSMASLPWCEKVFHHAISTINPEKLIIGVPLYGRSWQKPSLARAYKNSDVMKELSGTTIQPDDTAADGGSYTLTVPTEVHVHYETIKSINAKLKLYRSQPIVGVAFWRIGQEPDGLWQQIKN